VARDGRPAGVMDLDENGRGDTLGILRSDLEPVAVLFDIDEDSGPDFSVDELIDPANRSDWDFEVGLHMTIGSPTAAFYDTDIEAA